MARDKRPPHLEIREATSEEQLAALEKAASDPVVKAELVLQSITAALELDVEHYHPVTNKKLETVKEILECLKDNGSVTLLDPNHKCARCKAELVEGEEEKCWACMQDLCHKCWDEHGECGSHTETEKNQTMRELISGPKIRFM